MTQTDSPRGLMLAIGTYLIWGCLPVYMRALAHVSPAEVIAHRVVWSLPIALAVLVVRGRRSGRASGVAHGADMPPDVAAAAAPGAAPGGAEMGRRNGGIGLIVATLRQPRLVRMAALTALLISVNWLIYVWAIANDRAIEAALGYYINPLFSVLLGALLLGERLLPMQIAALMLAGLAVLALTVAGGGLPLIAVGLTLSWGCYAYCKRSLPLPANEGFTLEVLLLVVPALAYILWLAATGTGHFGTNLHDTLLLIGCGAITAVPLLLYANAAKLVRLSTMGVLQYITPTMVFLTAVFLFHEPFTGIRRLAFPMIWAALVLYSVSLLRARRAGRG